MDPSPPTWPRRFMAGLPHIPDTAMVGLLLVLLFLTGFALGALVCPVSIPQDRPSFQQQLDAIDTRLRTLEQR